MRDKGKTAEKVRPKQLVPADHDTLFLNAENAMERLRQQSPIST